MHTTLVNETNKTCDEENIQKKLDKYSMSLWCQKAPTLKNESKNHNTR